MVVIHPFIFYTRLFQPIPAVIGRKVGYTLDRLPVHHRATQRQTRHTIHAHTLSLTKEDLVSPINLTCMFLDGGGKPEYLEATHTYTGRTYKLHTEMPQPGIEPGTLLLC